MIAVDDSDRGRALSLTPVSRETEERLAILAAELGRWQSAKNLVAASTLAEVWTRHIADSIQIQRAVPEARRWLDLGSGGGFPGLVIGILLAEQGAGQIDLIESNARKCAFLRTAARVTGARATVHQTRIEDATGDFAGRIDAVTARAVAPLGALIAWCDPLLKTGAVGIFPKGQHLDAELTEAAKSWKIQMTTLPSVTDSSARLVIVRGAEKWTGS